jgi:hypothetical protein
VSTCLQSTIPSMHLQPGGHCDTGPPAPEHTGLCASPKKWKNVKKTKNKNACVLCVIVTILIDWLPHRLNMELDLQSLFGLHVTWCAQLYSLAETPQLPPPPAFGLALRGRYWSAKIDDISFTVTPWAPTPICHLINVTNEVALWLDYYYIVYWIPTTSH